MLILHRYHTVQQQLVILQLGPKATNLGGFGAGKTPETESNEGAGGWEGNQPGGFGRVKPQKPKAMKARGVGKATNLGGFGAGKTPKTESKESAGGRGLGRQPTWGDLGRVKPQKPKAKKARGVGKATNLGDLGG